MTKSKSRRCAKAILLVAALAVAAWPAGPAAAASDVVVIDALAESLDDKEPLEAMVDQGTVATIKVVGVSSQGANGTTSNTLRLFAPGATLPANYTDVGEASEAVASTPLGPHNPGLKATFENVHLDAVGAWIIAVYNVDDGLVTSYDGDFPMTWQVAVVGPAAPESPELVVDLGIPSDEVPYSRATRGVASVTVRDAAGDPVRALLAIGEKQWLAADGSASVPLAGLTALGAGAHRLHVFGDAAGGDPGDTRTFEAWDLYEAPSIRVRPVSPEMLRDGDAVVAVATNVAYTLQDDVEKAYFRLTEDDGVRWNATLLEEGVPVQSLDSSGNLTNATAGAPRITVNTTLGTLTLRHAWQNATYGVKLQLDVAGDAAPEYVYDDALVPVAPAMEVMPGQVFVSSAASLQVRLMHPVTGEPLAGQEVTLDRGPDSLTARTDSNGIAHVSTRFSSTAEVPVLVNGHPTGVHVTPVHGLSMRWGHTEPLLVGDAVELLVNDKGGLNPQTGVTVTVDGAEVGKTDEHGRVEFTAESAGEFTVTASKEGHVSASDTLRVMLGPKLTFGQPVLSPSEPTAGAPASIMLSVKNEGDMAGSLDLQLTVNNSVEDSVTVTLEPGESEDVALTWTPSSPGLKSVAVNGVVVEVTVMGDTATEETDYPSRKPDNVLGVRLGGVLKNVPGFTHFTTIAALAVVVVAWRRWEES